MNKKTKWIIIVIILIAVISLTTIVTIHKQRENVVIEIIVFPGGWGHNSDVYRFIIRNDMTLISHFGRTNNPGYVTRGNIIRFVRQRATTTLSEEDFQAINEIMRYVVMDESFVLSEWQPRLLYNGYVYGNYGVSRTLFDLSSKVYRLSPLSSR